jgi:hypothetical protein
MRDDEGEEASTQGILLGLGRIRFGPPEQGAEDALRKITDPDRLLRMMLALLHVTSWKEFLETP